MTEPIEAAAKAWFDRTQEARRDDGRKHPGGGRWQWDDLPADDQRAYRSLVEPIVVAALAAAETVDT